MIRKYMRTRLVEQMTEERREVICDGCGNVIGTGITPGFFQVVTHHNRWGNDSYESYETHHFCRKACMDAFLNGYWSNPGDSDQADIEFCCHTNGATCSESDSVETVILEEDTQN